MADECLDKFQKWVLNEIFENEVIEREWLRTFLGIKPPRSYKEWLRTSFGVEPPKSFREAKFYGDTNWKPINTKQRDMIDRSIKNMFDKDLIGEFKVKWSKDKSTELFGYILTEKGFNTLKSTNYERFKNFSFKDYCDRFNEWKDEYFGGFERLKQDYHKLQEKYHKLI